MGQVLSSFLYIFLYLTYIIPYLHNKSRRQALVSYLFAIWETTRQRG